MSNDKPVSSKPNFDIPAPILDSVKSDNNIPAPTFDSIGSSNDKQPKPKS